MNTSRYLERLYTDTMSVKRYVETIEDYLTKSEYQEVYTNIKCRISWSSNTFPVNESGLGGNITRTPKIFISNDIKIHKSDRIKVKRGSTEFFLEASIPSNFTGSHQEIICKELVTDD